MNNVLRTDLSVYLRSAAIKGSSAYKIKNIVNFISYLPLILLVVAVLYVVNIQVVININIESQNKLRFRPDILISIYGRFLGSNLHFRNSEKLLEGGDLCVRLTSNSASCYQIMFNSPGVLSRHNASLVL